MLTLLLEELQPRPSQLDHEEGRMEWAAQYSTVAPVVLHILNDSELMLATLPQPAAADGQAQEGGEEEEVMAINILPYGDKCKQQLVAVRWVGLLLVSQAMRLLRLVLESYP